MCVRVLWRLCRIVLKNSVFTFCSLETNSWWTNQSKLKKAIMIFTLCFTVSFSSVEDMKPFAKGGFGGNNIYVLFLGLVQMIVTSLSFLKSGQTGYGPGTLRVWSHLPKVSVEGIRILTLFLGLTQMIVTSMSFLKSGQTECGPGTFQAKGRCPTFQPPWCLKDTC